MADIIRLKPRRKAFGQKLSRPGVVLVFPRSRGAKPETAESTLTQQELAEKKSRRNRLDNFMDFSWPGTKDS